MLNNSYLNFIAEISSNHNQSLSRCYKLIDKAKDVGCKSVKFQHFKIEELFHSRVLKKKKSHRDRKKWELPDAFIPKISKYCKSKDMLFGCSPFSIKSVEYLNHYVDFFKISSYEILWQDLLLKIASTKKPVVFSTGMANFEEVKKCLNTLSKNGSKDITILHCVSQYPAKIKNCNLKSIKYMKDKLNCKIGWSDHTKNPLIIKEIIDFYGIKTIEFHFDLDKKGYEYGPGHCWLPHEIGQLIDFYKEKKQILGKMHKKFSEDEKKERLWRSDPDDGLRPFKIIRKKI